MRLVVPQVVDSVALLVVEGLLLAIRSEQVALAIQSPGELFGWAPELLL